MNPQQPVVTAHDAFGGGEAEAAPGELGGEEGIEDALQGFGAHADSVVLHFDEDVVSRTDLAHGTKLGEIGFREALRPGGDGDAAGLVIRDGFGSIDDEIHDELLELRSVTLDGGKLLGEVQMDDDMPGDGALDEIADFADQGG